MTRNYRVVVQDERDTRPFVLGDDIHVVAPEGMVEEVKKCLAKGYPHPTHPKS